MLRADEVIKTVDMYLLTSSHRLYKQSNTIGTPSVSPLQRIQDICVCSACFIQRIRAIQTVLNLPSLPRLTD